MGFDSNDLAAVVKRSWVGEVALFAEAANDRSPIDTNHTSTVNASEPATAIASFAANRRPRRGSAASTRRIVFWPYSTPAIQTPRTIDPITVPTPVITSPAST